MAVGIYGGTCADKHSVYIFDRGGMTRLAQILDVSTVQWSRDRDAVSEATVRIQGAACSAQAEILASIEPKRHEMVIFRGSERVWEGPIWRVGWHSDWVEINAHDVCQYLFGTPLSQPYSNAYPNVARVTDRIQTILDHELDRWEALTPPANIYPYLDIHHFANEAETTAATLAFESTVGEHIAHLAHYGGIDFAAVGRAIHFWDVNRSLGQTRMLTEADFLGSEVILTAYGADHTQHAYVIGEDGIYGEAHNSENEAYYGPWTTIWTAYNEEGNATAPTQAELNSQADRNLSGRSPVPVEVRVPDNSTIRLNETLGINDLIPGVKVPVLATLNARRMSQMQRLDTLVVTEDDTNETVQITLVPATSNDDDVEIEE